MGNYLRRGRIAAAVVAGMLVSPAMLRAENEVSLYGGLQASSSSDVSGVTAGGDRVGFTADWDGKSLDNPVYWGARYTYWPGGNWGAFVDFTHSKLYATQATRRDNGYDTLEFTDGLNALTFGVQRRFEPVKGFTPYVGIGAGIVIPHVEIRRSGETHGTFGYEYGGLAAELRAGASYRFDAQWNVFAEYEGNFVALDVDTDDGGNLRTDVFTNAVNIGVGFAF